MTNVILPAISYLLMLGRTIDLTGYDFTSPILKKLYNGTDAVETQINALNSTYYVLPDANIPYSALGVPIDLAIGLKTRRFDRTFVSQSDIITSSDFDNALILVNAEYRTIDRSLKENATPFAGWQKVIPKSHTHYVDRMIHGSSCTTLIRIRSTVTGDVQIFRKILRDVMGESGRVGKDTIDLWKKALKSIKESPDVRGEVYVDTGVMSTVRANLPPSIYGSIENFLKYVSEFSKYAQPPVPERNEMPLYVNLKPIHDLDSGYRSLEKNVEAEKYMVKLDALDKDADYTHGRLDSLFRVLLDEYDEKKLNIIDDFERRERSAWKALRNLTYSGYSIYKDINLSAFKKAFEIYENGLDKGTNDYFTGYKRLSEDLAARCENKFLRPARGSLKVEDNEVVKKGKVEGELKGCQDLCVEDKRCKAVGYSEEDRNCWIYYRSTSTATISFPKELSDDMKIYDRLCK